MNFAETVKLHVGSGKKVIIVSDSNARSITSQIIKELYGEVSESTCRSFLEAFANNLSFYVVSNYTPKYLLQVVDSFTSKEMVSVVFYDTPQNLLLNKGFLFDVSQMIKNLKITVDFK